AAGRTRFHRRAPRTECSAIVEQLCYCAKDKFLDFFELLSALFRGGLLAPDFRAFSGSFLGPRLSLIGCHRLGGLLASETAADLPALAAGISKKLQDFFRQFFLFHSNSLHRAASDDSHKSLAICIHGV